MDKSRWKNYGLWVSIAAFIPLLLSNFGIQLVGDYQALVNTVLSILVMAGIISNPTTSSKWYGDDSSQSTTQPPTQTTQDPNTTDKSSGQQ